MKIAFVLNNLSNTGTNIATRDLIYQLKEKYSSIEIDIYFFDKVNNELIIYEKKNQISFFSNIDFTRYDIVHSSNLRSDAFVFLNKLIKFYNKKTKFVTSIHSIIEEDLTCTYSKLISKVVSPFWIFLKKRNDAIIVSSDSMYLYYLESFKNKNLNVIEYGRSIEPLIEFVIPDYDNKIILGIKDKYKIIGTVGALISRKNYVLVIDLLLKNKNFAWVCLGIGDELEKLTELLIKFNIQDRVVFLGFKPDSRPYYKYFDLFFHPSKSEGFALVIIDAMSHKIPMLLSSLDVYKSIIKEDMAFYFDLNDAESLQIAFENFLKGDIHLSSAIDKSFEIYKTTFSIEQYGNKHFKIFNDLVKLNTNNK
jgi:glycosyltransferase involved in cell wall biosynthesis